jgi:LacI family transcriptional regulator
MGRATAKDGSMVAIREVAQRAGVSVATVSRVINDSPLVNEPLRQKVRQVMADLDYTPSAPARSLKGGRTKLLGVLVAQSPNPFFGTIVRGIEDVAYVAGYGVIVCSSDYDRTREATYISILRQHRVSGIIVTPLRTYQDEVPALRHGRTPVVSIDQRLPGADSVMLDNVAAARLATAHLIGLGHRRIGLITGPLSTVSGRGRLVGYRRAARQAGLPLERALQAAGPFTEQSGYELTRTMLARPDRPSALVTATNDLTLGAMVAARRTGLRIPDDLALVGFDEMSWTQTLVSPVTTVVQPAYEIGVTACHLMLDRLLGRYDGAVRRLYLPAHLSVRQSCGAPVVARDAAADRLCLEIVPNIMRPAMGAAPILG